MDAQHHLAEMLYNGVGGAAGTNVTHSYTLTLTLLALTRAVAAGTTAALQTRLRLVSSLRLVRCRATSTPPSCAASWRTRVLGSREIIQTTILRWVRGMKSEGGEAPNVNDLFLHHRAPTVDQGCSRERGEGVVRSGGEGHVGRCLS
jgi:hypothetical protein